MYKEARQSKPTPPRHNAYVLGASSSGKSIARYLLDRGVCVFMSDRDRNASPDIEHPDLTYSSEGHEFDFVTRSDVIILSPGVPADDPVVQFSVRSQKTLFSTVEFVASESSSDLIVVTGSSGKTTLIDIVRSLVDSASPSNPIFVTDRTQGLGIAESLAYPRDTPIVAELSVSELKNVCHLNPALLVITSLTEDNNHSEYNSFDAYLSAKFGWIDSLEQDLSIITGSDEAELIRNRFKVSESGSVRLHFDERSPNPGPVSLLATQAARIIAQLGLSARIGPKRILDTIRNTLLGRCESIDGHAMPIINIGKCKNSESLLWTARAICGAPGIISIRSLSAFDSHPTIPVLDLSRNPLSLDEAIDSLLGTRPTRHCETIVIDQDTRDHLFDGLEIQRSLPNHRLSNSLHD